MHEDGCSTSGLTGNGHELRIAAERCDRLLDPLHRLPLVLNLEISFYCPCEESPNQPQAVVDGDDDDVLIPGEICPVVNGNPTRASNEVATMHEHDHREVGRSIQRGREDVQVQAVFTCCWCAHDVRTRKGFWRASRHTTRRELCGIERTVPSIHFLRCGEAEVAYRRLGIGNPAEGEDTLISLANNAAVGRHDGCSGDHVGCHADYNNHGKPNTSHSLSVSVSLASQDGNK